MEKPLQIIDKKVEHLLENYQDGGEHKLIDWFLTGDINFVTQTAERYIVDYFVMLQTELEFSSVYDNY